MRSPLTLSSESGDAGSSVQNVGFVGPLPPVQAISPLSLGPLSVLTAGLPTNHGGGFPTSYPAAIEHESTILVVDDDPFVRCCVSAALEEAGHRVLQASSGEDAIRLAKDGSERIDLILTDVVMPNMKGDQVAEAVLETIPSAKILLMSGYSESDVLRLWTKKFNASMLPKPFSMRYLLGRVAEILRGDGPDRPPFNTYA